MMQMGSFKSTILTQKAHALMAKLTVGTATSAFTKIKSSDHDYSALTSNQLEALTALEEIKQEVSVSEVKRINDASVKVTGTILNTELTEGYYIKAIGLYANDPDEGEILYSITVAIESDWMPPYNSISSASALYDLVTTVSNAENVSIDVDPNAVVSITQFNEFKENVNAQMNENVNKINLYSEILCKAYNTISDSVGISLTKSRMNNNFINSCVTHNLKYVRTDLNWQTVEKIKGIYDFSPYDTIINNIIDNNLIPILILDYGNSFYGDNERDMKEEIFPYFINFIKAAVERYKNKNIVWEIYNEPNLETFWSNQNIKVPVYYTNLLKLAYTEIKKIDKTSIVCGCALSANPSNISSVKPWLDVAFRNGALEYMDVLTIHPYTNQNPETLINFYNSIKAIITKYTYKNIPIWCGEVGYSIAANWNGQGNNAVITENERSKYLVRLILINTMCNINRTIIHSYVTNESNNAECEEWFGIFKNNSSNEPYPSADAIKTLLEELQGFVYLENIILENGIYILKFTNSNNIFKYCIWSTKGTATINILGVDCVVTDSVTIKTINNVTNNIINKDIVYLESYVKNEKPGQVVNDFSTVDSIKFNDASNKVYGSYSIVAGKQNVCGEQSQANGTCNVAFPGVILPISGVDIDNKVLNFDSKYDLSNIIIGDKCSIKVSWDIGEVIYIVDVDNTNKKVYIDKTPSNKWSYFIYRSNKYAASVSGANNVATGECSIVNGKSNYGSGDGSATFGSNLINSNFSSVVVGKYNSKMNEGGGSNSQIGDVFIVGNGNGNDTRGNAFRVDYSGNAYGLSAFNSSGADFAEFHEWKDGNINNEDRIGYFVTNVGNKIEKARENDFILGVISGNPCLVGNADEDYQGKFLKDNFGRFIYEDIEEEIEQINEDTKEITYIVTGKIIKNGRLKLNPNYDNTKKYIERKNRSEWDYVCKRGMIPVRDDGSCIVGKWCKCNEGSIATITDMRTFDTFMVLERITDNIVLIEFK
jgi:hypothetical protein